ncbi:MAG: hypothetical protein ACI4UH_01610, partial [Dorea sp.]
TDEDFKKVQKTSNISVKNMGVDSEELNPLRLEEDAKLQQAVLEYYRQLTKEQEFAEMYHDIVIYTKKGEEKHSYVMFVQYKMKIEGIYSEVPGLETLYAREDEFSGEYQIYSEALDRQMKKDIQMVIEHADVRKLFERVEKEYDETLQSDALLREALLDLENAVETQ